MGLTWSTTELYLILFSVHFFNLYGRLEKLKSPCLYCLRKKYKQYDWQFTKVFVYQITSGGPVDWWWFFSVFLGRPALSEERTKKMWLIFHETPFLLEWYPYLDTNFNNECAFKRQFVTEICSYVAHISCWYQWCITVPNTSSTLLDMETFVHTTKLQPDEDEVMVNLCWEFL